MKKYPPVLMSPKAHRMTPGAVAFIPGWIMLFIVILTFALLSPSTFGPNGSVIAPLFLAFIIGSLMPAFDDIFAFLFGPPFAHHSLFHSLFGPLITFVIFLAISDSSLAKFALYGNITHIIFNYSLDYVTLFFPINYSEYGLTDIIGINTYWIKAIAYPIILVLFAFSVLTYLN